MSQRFYVNLPLAPGPFVLDGVEAHHLSVVCRLRPGDAVCLFNGDGHEYPARILKVGRREIALEVDGIETPRRELPFALEVAAPVPKGDRGQFLIEKLTELGVTTYIPLLCARSNTHPREARRDKLERHVIEASKQCGRNVLMRIEDLTEWNKYLDGAGESGLHILAHLGNAGRVSSVVDVQNAHAQGKPIGSVHIAVGPEGGLTDDEASQAIALGWRAVTLGPRTLRIETAALYLVAVLGAAAREA
jgi:16S rRNA (uracil1498-N3)-methyltransferase